MPTPGWPVVVPPNRELEPGDPDTVGPYRTEAVLGAGGMGRVFLGRTPAGAAVAVKVVHREFADDPGFRRRFEQEIATARLVHGLYTVPVVDADAHAERPWLATAYVPAASVQYVVAGSGPLPADTGLRLVAGVAEALQSLHAAGVVHRDLKPSNVLLTADGPRVIDFGIARAADATSVTGTGVLTGTPAYLAPEYIRGQEVTGTADVFALGVLAYFAVTGRLAFGGGHSHAVTYRILEQEPDLAGCPEPLRSIVASCLDKQPRQRPTPDEIIRRCQGNAVPPAPAVAYRPAQPVPSVQPVPLAQRPLNRRRLLLAAGLTGAAALGVAVPLLWPDDEDPQPRPASRGTSVDDGRFRRIADLSHSSLAVTSLSFSPDGRTLATGGQDRAIRLWDVRERLQRASFTAQAHPLTAVAFSPDGRTLASCADVNASGLGHDSVVRLWDVTTRQPRAELIGHPEGVNGVAFSPDGQLLASAGTHDSIRLWNVADGTEHAVLKGRISSYANVAFSPDGRFVASASSNDVVGVWDVATGEQLADLTGHTQEVWTVAFNADGLLASASRDGTVRLWDMESGRQQTVLTQDAGLSGLAFSPDGTLIATGNWSDTTVILWDVATGERHDALTVKVEGLDNRHTEDVAFGHDGRTLATAYSDGTVMLWARQTG